MKNEWKNLLFEFSMFGKTIKKITMIYARTF